MTANGHQLAFPALGTSIIKVPEQRWSREQARSQENYIIRLRTASEKYAMVKGANCWSV